MAEPLLADLVDAARAAGASLAPDRVAAALVAEARARAVPLGRVAMARGARVPAAGGDPAFRAGLAAVLRAIQGSAPGQGVLCRADTAREGTMAQPLETTARVDPVWDRVREEAAAAIAVEPLMGGPLHAGILHHASLEDALAYRFAVKLASSEIGEQLLREVAGEAHAAEAGLGDAARADLVAVLDRDPATQRLLQPLMFFKGFQAVQAHRVAHWLWGAGRCDLAYLIQMRTSEAFGVDIHPGARIGRGIMIDHAHSIVIGETAVVGDNVSMLHSVTLGGTGKEHEDRHPKIADGVLIGAGAKVLGNIRVGHCSRVAAGSVVLEEVPPCKTVAGVPARIVGEAGCSEPSRSMNHLLR